MMRTPSCANESFGSTCQLHLRGVRRVGATADDSGAALDNFQVGVGTGLCSIYHCFTKAIFGFGDTAVAELCIELETTGMVDINNPCGYGGCSKRPRYGTEGSKTATFCREHKGVGMVDVTHKLCAFQGCSKRPSYATEGSKTSEVCREHMRVGMVDVTRKLCSYQGCSKRPTYGRVESKTVEVCGDHKEAGMVCVAKKRCAHQGCPKTPTFGNKAGKKRDCCSDHKKVGMVSILIKQCAYQNCFKRPSYGKEGSKKAEVCSEHKKAGMVDVAGQRCGHQGCSKQPSFGREGSTKREFCSEHKRAGMVDVASKRCGHRGCSKRPSFGREGSTKREFCSDHKTTGMVNIFCKRCTREGCAKIAAFGLDGSRRKRVLCTRHFTEGDQGSSVEATSARANSSGVSQKAVEQVARSKPRRREVRVDCFPRQVPKTSGDLDCGASRAKRMRVLEREERDPSQEPEKVPAHVEESHEILSFTGLASIESLDRSDQSRAATPPHFVPPGGVVRTSTGERELAGSTGTAGSGRGFRKCGGGGGSVSAVSGDASITSPCTGAGSDVSATTSLECSHTKASCAIVPEDQLKIASLEHDKRKAVIEISKLRDKVEHLENTVVDAAVGRADAVAKATGEAEEKHAAIIQALRDELGAVSRDFEESKGAYLVVCEERKGLREQVALAANMFKAHANKTNMAEEGYQQRIEALRAALNEASTRSEKTKDELREICQERDALQKQDTKTQARVASAVRKFKAEAATGQAQEGFQQRIEALLAELTSASTGWEETDGEIKQIRQERDALHKEVVKMESPIAPRPQIPASVLQTMMGGLQTFSSPAATAAAFIVAQSSGGAPASDLPTSPANVARRSSVDRVGEKGRVDDHVGVCELKHKRAAGVAALPQGCLDISKVEIKPEA